jgi:predicted anti-sigma-YlaC factor YlaD
MESHLTDERAPLTCRELVELVTDYLEGALPPLERERFEEHIGMCELCRTHLEQVRLTIRLLGSLTEATIPPQARDELLMAFRNWRSGR